MWQRRWEIFGNRKLEELPPHFMQLVSIFPCSCDRNLQLIRSSRRRRANLRACHWSGLNCQPSPRVEMDRVYRGDMGIYHSGDVYLRIARDICPSPPQGKGSASAQRDRQRSTLPSSRTNKTVPKDNRHQTFCTAASYADNGTHGHLHSPLRVIRLRTPLSDSRGLPHRLSRTSALEPRGCVLAFYWTLHWCVSRNLYQSREPVPLCEDLRCSPRETSPRSQTGTHGHWFLSLCYWALLVWVDSIPIYLLAFSGLCNDIHRCWL
jgi:hypothetical protein